MRFTVVGIPVPQGSMKAFTRRGGGRPIMTSDNARTRPWKDAVVWAAADALAEATIRGPVEVALTFRFGRPKSHHGKRGLLPSAPRLPSVRPDLDKLVRAILDALVEASVMADDAQVVTLSATKDYAADWEHPGVDVSVLFRGAR